MEIISKREKLEMNNILRLHYGSYDTIASVLREK